MQANVHAFPPHREAAAAPAHDGHGHHAQAGPGFWPKYIFSTDHKVIGIQYGLMALSFMLFGFFLMLLMRWQLAYPGQPMPFIGKMFGEINMPGGVMLPEFYNQLGAID